MKILRLIGMTLVVIMIFTNITACNDDNSEETKGSTIEDYCSLLYGSWYKETKEEYFKNFKRYIFSTDKSLVVYTKYANRLMSPNDGIYTEWRIYPETISRGVWYVEQKENSFYLRIKWNGNGSYNEYLISYLDDKILNFGEGYSGDLYRGDNKPDF